MEPEQPKKADRPPAGMFIPGERILPPPPDPTQVWVVSMNKTRNKGNWKLWGIVAIFSALGSVWVLDATRSCADFRAKLQAKTPAEAAPQQP